MRILFGLGLAATLFFLSACSKPDPNAAAPEVQSSITNAMTTADQGFARALPGYTYSFPRDAGSHPAYRTEWWYYTGHLHTRNREWGFELTFFRIGLTATPRKRESRWATSNVYLAHFALTDPQSGQFQFQDRADRGSLGLSGAALDQEKVWIQDWIAECGPPGESRALTGSDPDTGIPHNNQQRIHSKPQQNAYQLAYSESRHLPSPSEERAPGGVVSESRRLPSPSEERAPGGGVRGGVGGAAAGGDPNGSQQDRSPEWWPHHLRASAPFGAIDLVLHPLKKSAIQGPEGISRKGAGPGQASHYYSYSRLAVTGVLKTGSGPLEVTGLAWMDHEFASNQLAGDLSGWDWFSVQLQDGWDLMLYRLRRNPNLPGPAISPFSSGSLIAPDGQVSFFTSRDFQAIPQTNWKSSQTGSRYPVSWQIEAPGAGLSLQETAILPDQELVTGSSTGVVYWEGAMRVNGTHLGHPVKGEGYTELTGYGAPLTQLR